MRTPRTSPHCRNVFLLSPDDLSLEYQCRDDVSELKLDFLGLRKAVCGCCRQRGAYAEC